MLSDHTIKILEMHEKDMNENPDRHAPFNKEIYTKEEASNLCTMCLSYFDHLNYSYDSRTNTYIRNIPCAK